MEWNEIYINKWKILINGILKEFYIFVLTHQLLLI